MTGHALPHPQVVPKPEKAPATQAAGQFIWLDQFLGYFQSIKERSPLTIQRVPLLTWSSSSASWSGAAPLPC